MTMYRSGFTAIALAGALVSWTSGEKHIRHHVTADGFYRGRKVIDKGNDE